MSKLYYTLTPLFFQSNNASEIECHNCKRNSYVLGGFVRTIYFHTKKHAKKNKVPACF